MSTALITGLVLSGPVATAEVISEEGVSTPTESSTSADAQTAPVVSQSPVANIVESERSILPAETSAAADDSEVAEESEPTVTESPASAESDATSELAAEVSKSTKVTHEASEAQIEDLNEVPESEPATEETEAAQVPVQKSVEPVAPVAKSVAPVSPEPSKESSTSFGVVSLDDRWEEIDALLPDGVEDWSDAQWEEFENSEAGQEYIRQVDELLAEEYSAEDDFELTEEEQAFWESIFASLPEDSFEWDEAQWEEYFLGDAGVELILQMLPVIVDSIETDEDAADLQEFLEDVFANDPEQLAYYLELYLGITPETTGGSSSGSVTAEEPVASESTRPVAETEIKPAASISKSIVSKAKAVKKPAQTVVADSAESPVLADTGFDGAWAVGLGALLAIAGAVFVARSRKASAK